MSSDNLNSSNLGSSSGGISVSDRRALFWACFTAIGATAAVFAVRGQIIGDWGREFDLTETQKGEILGVGLWPFAAAIVLVSLFADRVGFGRFLTFAFICHVGSTILLLFARNYWWLYAGTFLVSVGNGAAQAIADPMVASMYRNNKTTWLNILHASWPAGLAVGGIAAIALGSWGGLDWRWRVGMLLVPILLYGILMLGHKFPVHERIEAGVSDQEMLRETGGIGALLVLVFLFSEFGRLLEQPWYVGVLMAAACGVAFGRYTRSFGNPVFLILLFLMVPLATTELGTDSWITSIMEAPMKAMALNAGWVLVYTSLIMMLMRFCAAPVVKWLTPIGVLLLSCILAMLGLVALSTASGFAILVAATLYGIGKAYLWPTMLGVVAERFPKGGALSLNATSAVGMMSVGVMGTVFLGLLQDHAIESRLRSDLPAIHQKVLTTKHSVLGSYPVVNPEKARALSAPDQDAIARLSAIASKEVLAVTAVLPAIMLAGYIGLFALFRRRGGYYAVELVNSRPT